MVSATSHVTNNGTYSVPNMLAVLVNIFAMNDYVMRQCRLTFTLILNMLTYAANMLANEYRLNN